MTDADEGRVEVPAEHPLLGGASAFEILLAALVHIAFGIVFVFGAVILHRPWWEGAATIMGIAVVKETLIDPYDFEKNPFWNGTLNSGAFDLAMYVVGVAIAYAFLLFSGNL